MNNELQDQVLMRETAGKFFLASIIDCLFRTPQRAESHYSSTISTELSKT